MIKKNYAFTLLIAMTFMQSAHAYKYIIYTDEVATNTSEKVAEIMKTTYPFKNLNVEVEIIKVTPEELECQSSMGIDRLITCKNLDGIQNRALKDGGDQAMIVKSLAKYGGSSGVGGGVPVITNSSNPRVMLHEYLHTLGLCDEYEYSKNEAEIWCNDISKSPNIVLIQPLASYANDDEARAIHGSKIPWFSDIIPTTPITSGHMLGTGVVDAKKLVAPNPTNIASAMGQSTGLYRGKVCNNSVPVKIAWHPGGGATIMENIEAGLGAPLEKIVERTLLAKGARNKLQITEREEISTPSESESGSRFIAQAEPPVQVNNSSRNIFKSFFGWLTNMFQSLTNALTR